MIIAMQLKPAKQSFFLFPLIVHCFLAHVNYNMLHIQCQNKKHRICSLLPKGKLKIVCHCEERSDVTIHSGIASISTCTIIEAMPLGVCLKT